MLRVELICDVCAARAASDDAKECDPPWLGLKSSDREEFLHFCPPCATRVRAALNNELTRYTKRAAMEVMH